jgi:hypothetical protein
MLTMQMLNSRNSGAVACRVPRRNHVDYSSWLVAEASYRSLWTVGRLSVSRNFTWPNAKSATTPPTGYPDPVGRPEPRSG